MLLISSIIAGVFDEQEITEEQVQKVLEGDVLSELMQDLGNELPTLKTVLIDERDRYISQKMRDSEGDRIVSVVGAGHVEGIKKALLQGEETDLEGISFVPARSRIWRWVGWGVPVVILGSIAAIGWNQGAQAAGDNALYWILANGIPSAVGAALALAHPFTILAAFVSAPLTSLTPLIGAAYVTAFVQTWVRPPRVHEFQSVAEDIGHLTKWWKSRLLRIFLAFFLPGIGSMIGTWIGGYEIVSNLLR